MSSKPENQFISSVHKHMPPIVPGVAGKPYREKMYNPLRGGTWDVWYSGAQCDLWIEYKFIVLPKRDTTMITPELSPLQVLWGRSRALEGRNLAVIVGCKEGGVIMTAGEWEHEISTAAFRERLMSRQLLAGYIVDYTQGSS